MAKDLHTDLCMEEIGLGGQRLVVEHRRNKIAISGQIKTDHPHWVRSLASQHLPSSAGAARDFTTMTLVADMSTNRVLTPLGDAHW